MPRVQINLIGTSSRTGASWAVTTQWAFSTLPTFAAMTTQLTAARAALVASAPFRAGIASNYGLVSLRALGYPVPTGHALWTVDAGGTKVNGTGNILPLPLSVVVSEQTGNAGPSYRGRSYWPAAAGADAFADGSVSTPTQALVRTSWLAMHNIIAASLTPLGGSPVHVVFSPKTGNMTPISVIRTGNRVDTARGRFGDAPETYISEAVPAAALLAFDPEDDEVPVAALGPVPLSMSPSELAEFLGKVANGQSPEGIHLGPLNQLIFDAGLRLIPPPIPDEED